MRSDTDGAPACPDASSAVAAAGPAGGASDSDNLDQDKLDGSDEAPKKLLMLDEEKYIKEYPECPMAFDQMIITISQYFDLVNLNSYKLEDLWLNLIDVMGLDRPNKYTVFKAVHH